VTGHHEAAFDDVDLFRFFELARPLTQVAAASKALQGVGLHLLDEHLQHCVAGAAASGDTERTGALVHEATKAVERMLRA